MLSRRVTVLLDLLIGLLALLQLAQSLAGYGHVGRAVTLMGLVGSVLMATCWIAWRRTGARWLLAALCVAGFLSTGDQGSGSAILVVIVGIALATFGCGIRVGTALAALQLVLIAASALGSSPERLLVQVVGIAVMLALGVLMGQVLRELQAERRRNADLVDQVRASAVVEQELMLADERARSARELHDGLGHQLTLVGMSLEYAERMWERDAARAREELGQARTTAADALAYMRRWVRALNPPREDTLDHDGFEAIARSFRGTGLAVELTHSGAERRLGRDESLFALRMVQEGLTNVLRHSSADRVDLRLGWLPDRLELRIRDNGGAGASLAPGFGLRSLAERARGLGGSFDATSDDAGVELVASIPTGAVA